MKQVAKYLVSFAAIGAGVSLSAIGVLSVLADMLTVKVTKSATETPASTETVNEQ